MNLHDAVRFARLERRLSQKKLSEMAGIQRKQLDTLEKGGNVTLATVRKVLAQLPNLEKFTIDTVQAEVRMNPPPPIVDMEKFYDAMNLMIKTFERLGKRLADGQLPTSEDVADLHEVNVKLLSDLPKDERMATLGDLAPDFPELMHLPQDDEEEG